MKKVYNVMFKVLIVFTLVFGLFIDIKSIRKVHGVGITFAEQFPNAHTAEVMASEFYSRVNDEIYPWMTAYTSLHFYGKQLTDIRGISIFENLTQLDLGTNLISSIPKEISELKKLEHLHIGENKLSEFPLEICKLTNLSSLTIINNKMSVIPKEIGNLKKLLHLNLYSNNIEMIPSELSSLSNLISLTLSTNKISELPNNFGDLSNLGFLDLSFNNLDKLPESFLNLKNLANLTLESNNFTTIPTKIGTIPKLTAIILSANKIEEIPSTLDDFSNLNLLDLSFNKIKVISNEITKLKNMRYLFLQNNNLVSLPSEIGNMTNLLFLNVDSNSILNLPANFINLNKDIELIISNNFLPSDAQKILNEKGFANVKAEPQKQLKMSSMSDKVHMITSESDLIYALKKVNKDIIYQLEDGTVIEGFPKNNSFIFGEVVDKDNNVVNVDDYFKKGKPNASVMLKAKLMANSDESNLFVNGNAVVDEQHTLIMRYTVPLVGTNAPNNDNGAIGWYIFAITTLILIGVIVFIIVRKRRSNSVKIKAT